MSECRDEVIQLACFTPTTGARVTVKYVTVFDSAGRNIAEYYSDDAGVTIDPTTYLGGGVATLGACEAMQVECVESQEWTYGIDNTGTVYNDVATYCFVLSDGSTLEFAQDGTASSWSPQLIEWAANIQAAADGAGLAWFVEPRFLTDTNLTNGGYGLAGAPSETIGRGLYDGGMRWRYLNIQVCAGQPVPVRAYRKTSTTYGDGEFDLTSAGAFLGPINTYKKCVECGTSKDIYYALDEVANDGTYREAIASEIPKCPIPCGTLTLADSPPDRDCTFQTVLACDSNNSTLTTDFIPDITRRATICNGQQISVDYFQADPNDPNALIPYTLVDRFVDCATGEEVVLPEPPCQQFELVTAYSLEGELDGELTNREWHDSAPYTPLGQGTTAVGAAYRESHDFSLPVTTQGTQASLVLNDTDNTAAELDVQVIDGYVVVDTPMDIRYTATSEGYIAIELGVCGGELALKAETGGFGYTTDAVSLPVGIHRIRLWNIDSGGSNSSATAQYSLDGVNFTSDNTPPGLRYSTTAPSEKCTQLRVCEDTLIAYDLFTGAAVDLADYYTCPLSCDASSGGSGAGGNVTVDNFPDQCEEKDLELKVDGGSSATIPAGFKSVTIINCSDTTAINGLIKIGDGCRLGSISFGTDRGNCINELLPEYKLEGGSWQWIGHR